jgi:ergothioneine biosynthesis protein EgtB
MEGLFARYREVRRQTEAICAPLETEDYVVQPMPDASPAKWHLAHSSWFFETFILKPCAAGYREADPRYHYLFNSYYVGAGERHPRAERGMLTRPTVSEVYQYRAHIDRAMGELLCGAPEGEGSGLEALVTLGLHHEQQHQELLVTDTKYLFSLNPLGPALTRTPPAESPPAGEPGWVPFRGGLREVGAAGAGFCFDNETPRHAVFLRDFRLAERPVTNAEYRGFIEDAGYRRPELWLSDGWAEASRCGWSGPLYWDEEGEGTFTAAGHRPVRPHDPVCHVSYYEADAYARWHGCRLPTEAEWEVAAAEPPVAGCFAEEGHFHPVGTAPRNDGAPRDLFGSVWEWTASPYVSYPGFRPLPGTLGEYNGKFMCNQLVLRGGSCATPRSHIRATYRNFFPPSARWQFGGIRLAQDA